MSLELMVKRVFVASLGDGPGKGWEKRLEGQGLESFIFEMCQSEKFQSRMALQGFDWKGERCTVHAQ